MLCVIAICSLGQFILSVVNFVSFILPLGSDVEKQALWMEWFSAVQDKNSTVRRETELSFK